MELRPDRFLTFLSFDFSSNLLQSYSAAVKSLSPPFCLDARGIPLCRATLSRIRAYSPFIGRLNFRWTLNRGGEGSRTPVQTAFQKDIINYSDAKV